MKLLILALTFISLSASAQHMDIKGVDAGDGDTTIQIKKGPQATAIDAQYEIIKGEEEVSGDPAPLLKDARDNWKKACSDWKKDTKNLNKENQIINLSCGKMSCQTAEMESTCVSQASSKVRVKVK